jgi:hypothetical protein
VRDAEVFLATRGTLEEAGFVLSGVAKVFPALPAALLGWLGSSSDKIIPEMISQTKSRLDKFYTRIDAFSISSPDAEERLRYHQQNFRDFLKARSDVDALFEEKSDAIANRHLSFSSVWNYGKDSSDLYKLELYHATAVISLDRAEEKYLEDSLLNISPLPAGWN